VDDVDDGSTDRGGSSGVNDKVLLELGGVASRVPEVNVGTKVREGNKGGADGATVALK
jgi:hypothetical protein